MTLGRLPFCRAIALSHTSPRYEVVQRSRHTQRKALELQIPSSVGDGGRRRWQLPSFDNSTTTPPAAALAAQNSIASSFSSPPLLYATLRIGIPSVLLETWIPLLRWLGNICDNIALNGNAYRPGTATAQTPAEPLRRLHVLSTNTE